MITLPTRKPASKKPTKASQVDSNGSSGKQGQQGKQAAEPGIDSAALYRRAKELSTEIQWESVVEQRSEKVDRIKAKIEQGTYEVDPYAIAEKLMEFDILIEGKQKTEYRDE